MVFKKTEYVGKDIKAANLFWKNEFKAAKAIGKSDEEAKEFADYMVHYYGHQFREYK